MQTEALLTDSERDYFYQWDQLFESPGWAMLVKELEHDAEELPERAFDNAKSFDEVLAARAAARKLREIIAYPQIIQLRRDALVEARLHEAEDASA